MGVCTKCTNEISPQVWSDRRGALPYEAISNTNNQLLTLADLLMVWAGLCSGMTEVAGVVVGDTHTLSLDGVHVGVWGGCKIERPTAVRYHTWAQCICNNACKPGRCQVKIVQMQVCTQIQHLHRIDCNLDVALSHTGAFSCLRWPCDRRPFARGRSRGFTGIFIPVNENFV